MENEKKQRDWMDWVQTGAAVSAAWDVHKISGDLRTISEWFDRKLKAQDEAKRKAMLKSAVAEARTLLENGIKDLSDDVYGYCQLKYLRDVTDRPEIRDQLQDTFNLCDARLRWMLKDFTPVQVRRVQDYVRVNRAKHLMTYYTYLALERKWNVKAQYRAAFAISSVLVSLALVFGLLVVGADAPQAEFTRYVAMAVGSGFAGVVAFLVIVFSGSPKDPVHQKLEETKPWSDHLYLFSSEYFQALVEAGAISQSEADRQTVDNAFGSFERLIAYAERFSDLQKRFKTEEAAFERFLAGRTNDERWAAKMQAEKAMEERYAKRLVEEEKNMEERYAKRLTI